MGGDENLIVFSGLMDKYYAIMFCITVLVIKVKVKLHIIFYLVALDGGSIAPDKKGI